ncbi:MAG: hypothetical protein ABI650_06055 [Dokdonella sp.]
MRSERAFATRLFGGILLVAANLHAFEPGSERVCEPSADGTRFECRDKNAPNDAPLRRPAEKPNDATANTPIPQVNTQTPVTSAPSAPTASSVNARALPGYLRNPSVNRGVEPASVAAPQREPMSEPVAEPAVDTPTPRAVAEPASMATSATSTPPASRAETPTRMPDSDSQTRDDSSAFAHLPAGRYSIEIARARAASELAAVTVALDDAEGRVYLIRLRGSNGPTYSVMWSDFATIDAAREARATLPADLAITSGWPRRIGPLQAELVGQ